MLKLPSVQQGYARSQGESEYPELWPGLVGAWPFGMQGSGNTAYDFSGYGNHGTLTNGPTWVSGRYGRALDFDGSTNHIDILSTGWGSYFSNSSNAVTAWVKTDTPGTRQVITADWNSGGSAASLHFELTASSQFQFGIAGSGGFIDATGGVVDQAWHFVAGTFDDASNEVRLYVDGDLINTNSQTNAMFNGSNATIGRGGAFNGLYFNGLIDNVLIHNRVLPPSEIQLLYKVPYAPFVKRKRIYGFQVAGAISPPPRLMQPNANRFRHLLVR